VREDLGHLLRREGVHGVGVDVALFKDVDVDYVVDFANVLATMEMRANA
jgi:hypothetical protein